MPAAKGSGRLRARSPVKSRILRSGPCRSPLGPQAAFLNAGVSASITVSFGLRLSPASVSAGVR